MNPHLYQQFPAAAVWSFLFKKYFSLFTFLSVTSFPSPLVCIFLFSVLPEAWACSGTEAAATSLTQPFTSVTKRLLFWAKCFSQSAVNCWENETRSPKCWWCLQRTEMKDSLKWKKSYLYIYIYCIFVYNKNPCSSHVKSQMAVCIERRIPACVQSLRWPVSCIKDASLWFHISREVPGLS